MHASSSLTITIDDDSELGRALDANSHDVIVLVRGRHRFHLPLTQMTLGRITIQSDCELPFARLPERSHQKRVRG